MNHESVLAEMCRVPSCLIFSSRRQMTNIISVVITVHDTEIPVKTQLASSAVIKTMSVSTTRLIYQLIHYSSRTRKAHSRSLHWEQQRKALDWLVYGWVLQLVIGSTSPDLTRKAYGSRACYRFIIYKCCLKDKIPMSHLSICWKNRGP